MFVCVWVLHLTFTTVYHKKRIIYFLHLDLPCYRLLSMLSIIVKKIRYDIEDIISEHNHELLLNVRNIKNLIN